MDEKIRIKEIIKKHFLEYEESTRHMIVRPRFWAHEITDSLIKEILKITRKAKSTALDKQKQEIIIEASTYFGAMMSGNTKQKLMYLEMMQEHLERKFDSIPHKDINQIIDFEIKGNQVKFLLGQNGGQWGDDWNDIPYEHNAGGVYRDYVTGEKILTFGWDDIVAEPATYADNSAYSKEDMIKRKIPCVVVLAKEYAEETWLWNFESLIAHEHAQKYYFGDTL